MALAAGAAVLLALVPGGGAAATVVDVPGRIVLESWQPGNLPNDPNRCITVQFLEFPAVPGAGAYAAVVLNHVLNVNQNFGAGPTFFPGDSYTVSVGPQNTHTFTAPGGSHRIVLGSESSGSGCNSTPRFSLVSLTTVVENPPPTAVFTWEVDGDDPLTVSFDASGSTDDEGIAGYEWDFGGDGTGGGQAPSHTFGASGTYSVTLTVTDTEGATGSVTHDVEVASRCDGTQAAAAPAAAEAGIARFLVVVRNAAGAGVRNVRVEIVVACGDETTAEVTSEPTNRQGGVLVEVPYEGDQQFLLTPLPFARFDPPLAVRPVAEGTTPVEFRTNETCFGLPVTVMGSEDADTLSLFSNDVLNAYAGQDTVTAGAGEQGFTVCGGADGDAIDLRSATSIGDRVDGGEGMDVIASGRGPDEVHGGDEQDRIVGGEGDDRLFGEDGPDEISGGTGCDGIAGGAGDDTIDAGGDADTVNAFGGCATGGVDAGDGNDTVLGGSGPDALVGGTGCDSLLGAGGDDRLYGGDDADSSLACPGGGLDGGSGADILEGGDGNDELHGGGNDDDLTGGPGADWLTGDGGCDRAVGGSDDDTIFGGAGADGPPAIGGCAAGGLDGGDGLDVIEGESGNDLLLGGNDCDRLLGGDGKDTIDGGEGDEAPSGCNGGIVDGGAGADTLFGGGGADLIGGGDGGDEISGDGGYGGAGALVNGSDRIFGDDGADTIFGGDEDAEACRGGDFIHGGEQRDIVFGGDGGDVLVGAGGNDDLRGGEGCDDIYGGTGKDTIDGDENPAGTTELLWGEADNDTVRGGGGSDAVYGGGGKDDLDGGAGDDVLDGGVTGGPGPFGSVPPDEFAVNSPVDTLVGGDHDQADRCAVRQQLDRLVGCEDQEFVQNNNRWAEFTLRPQP